MLINPDKIKEHFDGDEDILLEVIELFLEQRDSEVKKLIQAIRSKNSSEITISAHTLKGVVSNFYAEDLRKFFFEIEQKGKAQSVDNLEIEISKIETMFKQLLEEVESLKLSIQK